MHPRPLIAAVTAAVTLAVTALGTAAGVLGTAGCGAPASQISASADAARDRIAIVASERGAQGARLVAIDEHGDRQFELIQPASGVVRDSHPAVSPDGKWLVFASSRGRPLDQTSLWIAALGVTMPPRRLTDAPAIDAHPAWMPDGSAIVFASTRNGSDYNLWRLGVRDGRPGELTQLTRARGHEVTPAVAPDGTILYAEVTPDIERREIESHLEQRAPDGTVRKLTDGPADSSPAISPDGSRLVFARPVVHRGTPDSELWYLVRATGAIAPVIDLPLTDESGPVWSRDGRFVFATSVVRGSHGVVFSSIIHIDTRDRPPVARILEDRVGAIVRLTPAPTTAALDAAALHRDPEYASELARILSELVERQRHEAVEPAAPPTEPPRGEPPHFPRPET